MVENENPCLKPDLHHLNKKDPNPHRHRNTALISGLNTVYSLE